MAQRAVTRQGLTLTIPGAYTSTEVIAGQGNIGTSGVITLVGEADCGPHWSELEDLAQVAFRPDQLNNVLRTFASGNLVDGFRAAISGNADASIAGSANLIYLIKTNKSDKAKADVSRQGLGKYAEIQALLAGKPGNSISYRNTTAVAEQAPALQNVAIFPSTTITSDIKFRLNGSAEMTITVPNITVGLSDDLVFPALPFEAAGLLSQGGVARGVLPGGAATLALAPVSGNAVITLSTGSWAVAPQPNDVLLIHTASDLAAAGENAGSYRVMSATTSTVVAEPINIVGPLTAVSGAAQSSGPTRAMDTYSSVTFTNVTGTDREILEDVAGDITSSDFTASSVKLSLDPGVLFAATPQVGELVFVPANVIGVLKGWYQIASVANVSQGQMVLNRLSNGALVSAPASTAVVSTMLRAQKADIDGVGKASEMVGDANTDQLVRNAFTGQPLAQMNSLIVSAAERSVQTLIAKQNALNPITETFVSGGAVALAVGYQGASCILEINDSVLETTCSNPADDLALELKDFSTVRQLVDYINNHPAYSAAVVDNRFNSLSPVRLDNVSTQAATSLHARPARLKLDADDWYTKVSQSAQVGAPVYAAAGLPDHELLATYLAAGAKNGTSGMEVVDAMNACEVIVTNFIVPLFEQDASQDIAEGKTEASSTYTIDAVNAYTKTHALECSQVVARKPRLAIVAKWSSLADAKAQARDLASPRVALAWFRIKDVASDGTIKTMPAWASACKVAGQQAAAGYKGIVKKFINISGVVYPQNFDPRRRGDLTDVLEAGLLVVEPVATGGFRNLSDQLTYSADSNFIYNSLQAMYIIDLMTNSMNEEGDRVLIGKSVAVMTASVARGWAATMFDRFLRLKWIAPSDDAPLGYKNLNVQIQGGLITIDAQLYLAGLTYFADISLAFSEVTQTA